MVVESVLLLLCGWPGVFIARRTIRGAATLSGLAISLAIVLGYVLGSVIIKPGYRASGWFPVLGLNEAPAIWIFIVVMPYVFGVAASFVPRWTRSCQSG